MQLAEIFPTLQVYTVSKLYCIQKQQEKKKLPISEK